MNAMVAAQKDQAKAGFSRRLSETLDGNELIPRGRGRRQAVAKRLKVSVESVRKWLSGEAIPDQAHLALLAGWLGVSADWLLTEKGRPLLASDELLVALESIWRILPVESRTEVIAFARFKANGDGPRSAPPEVARDLKSRRSG